MIGEDILTELGVLGTFAPLIAFLLGVAQAMFPYIPFFVLAGTNGLLFGFTFGLLISFSGALVGALVSFWLSRTWLQKWILNKFGQKYEKQIDEFSSEHGFKTVLIVRLIPVVPSPLINVLAGVSKIKFSHFTLASAIGKLPFAITYTIIGNEMAKYKDNQIVLTIIITLAVAIYLLIQYRKKKNQKEKEEKEGADDHHQEGNS